MHHERTAAALQRHALHRPGDAGRRTLRDEDYYSIGGGFVVRGDEAEARETGMHAAPPYPFTSGGELLALCREHGLEMYELMMAQERTWRSRRRGARGLLRYLAGDAGLRRARLPPGQGLLPGVLKVRRRAPGCIACSRRAASRRSAAMPWTG